MQGIGHGTWAASSMAYRPPQGLPLDYVPAYRPHQALCEIILFSDPSPSFPVCAHRTRTNPCTLGSLAKTLRDWRKGALSPLPTGAVPITLCTACRVRGGCSQTATTFLRLSEVVALTRGFLGVHCGVFLELGVCCRCWHSGPQHRLGLRQNPFARLICSSHECSNIPKRFLVSRSHLCWLD